MLEFDYNSITNAGWVAEVRSNSQKVKILPRVLFEGWSASDYMTLFADDKLMREVAQFITKFVDVSHKLKGRYMYIACPIHCQFI